MRASKINFTSLFQVFGLLILTLSLMACGDTREITMKPKGGGNGQDPANCTTDQCKATNEAKTTKVTTLALQAGNWAEIILLAAMEKEGRSTWGRCVKAELSSDKSKLTFQSQNFGCSGGKISQHKVQVKIEADIQRDSDGNVKKVTVSPNTEILATGEKDYSFQILTTMANTYQIRTDIRIAKLEITRNASYIFEVVESVEVESKRTPDSDLAQMFGESLLKTTLHENTGTLYLEQDENSKIVSKLELGKMSFDTEFLTEVRQAYRDPFDFKSSFELSKEDPQSPPALTHCGIPGGRYTYKSEMKKRSITKNEEWNSPVGAEDIVNINSNSVHNIIGNTKAALATCNEPMETRLWNFNDQLVRMFDELHGQIRGRSTTPTNARGRTQSPADRFGNGAETRSEKTERTQSGSSQYPQWVRPSS